MLCQRTILVVYKFGNWSLLRLFDLSNQVTIFQRLLLYFGDSSHIIVEFEVFYFENSCFNFFEPCVVRNFFPIELIQGDDLKLICWLPDHFKVIWEESSHEPEIIQIIKF